MKMYEKLLKCMKMYENLLKIIKNYEHEKNMKIYQAYGTYENL